MKSRQLAWIVVCLVAAGILPKAAHAQCTSTQTAAVECFVANAVQTKLATPAHGMSLAQYEVYGVAVTKFLQDPYICTQLVGLASAIADAMPATNASGSANEAAQATATNSMIVSAVTNHVLTIPAGTTEQQMEDFTLDLVSVLGGNKGVLLSPGSMLRVVDSYVVTATSGSTVNWTTVDYGLTTMVTNLVSTGLLKLPTSVTLGNAVIFTDALAQIIHAYKVSTGRTKL